MSYSPIDLHCHSLASDGALSPSDLVERAAGNGVSCMALTDHDTLDGQKEAFDAGNIHGVKVISGIELSCVWRSFTIHILGYNFDLESDLMREAVKFQTESRIQRAKLISEKLEKKGFVGLYQSASALSSSGVPGRPHFAKAMEDNGYVSSVSEAFKKYLGAGKIGDVKSVWPELETVVKWIVEAGGVAVIAHPRKYNMTLTKLREMIGDFKNAGGKGIELITSGQKQGEIGLLADLCQRMDLLASVGSDFHTPKYPWAELGRIPNLPKSVEPVWSQWESA